MTIPANVKTKPRLPSNLKWVTPLAIFCDRSGHGFYPNIYIPREIYDNLRSSKPDLNNFSLIVHEQAHLDRQQKKGLFSWIVEYLLSSKFRFDEELIAYKRQMQYLKKHKLEFPFERRAKALSSWMYLWPVNYQTALNQLKNAWDEA